MTLNGVMDLIMRCFTEFGSFRGSLRTRTHQEMRQPTWTFTQCARKLPEFAETTQNNGHYTVQGHSMSFKVTDFGTNRKLI